MTNFINIPKPAYQQGVILVEAMVAILIFSIGILGLMGLQATMIQSNTEGKYRSEAGFLAQQRIAEAWGKEDLNIGLLAEAGTSIPTLPNGARTTEIGVCATTIMNPSQPCRKVTVTVTWQLPSSPDVHNVTAIANVAVPSQL